MSPQVLVLQGVKLSQEPSLKECCSCGGAGNCNNYEREKAEQQQKITNSLFIVEQLQKAKSCVSIMLRLDENRLTRWYGSVPHLIARKNHNNLFTSRLLATAPPFLSLLQPSAMSCRTFNTNPADKLWKLIAKQRQLHYLTLVLVLNKIHWLTLESGGS